MSRDDTYEEYKSFNVPKELELIWVKEMFNDELKNLQNIGTSCYSVSKLTDSILSKISQYNMRDYLEPLFTGVISIIGRLDSFSKLLIAESAIRTFEDFQKMHMVTRTSNLMDLIYFSKNILNDIIEKPIIVDAYYKQVKDLKNEINPERIRERVFESLCDVNKAETDFSD